LDRYGTLSRTAMQAVGYREVIECLQSRDHWSRAAAEEDRGQRSDVRGRVPDPLGQCIARVKTRTRQFAKRQETWFRSLSECTIVPMTSHETPTEIADQVLALTASSARQK
jgi:tRNA dimethylallyltransferase